MSTLPPGPLNLRLMSIYLRDRAAWRMSVAGVVTCDVLICGATLAFTHSPFLRSQIGERLLTRTENALTLVFSCVLLGYGVFALRAHRARTQLAPATLAPATLTPATLAPLSRTPARHPWLSAYGQGFVGTLLVPGLIPFWVGWWTSTRTAFAFALPPVSVSLAALGGAAALLGVALGDGAVFSAYAFISARTARVLPTPWMDRFRFAAAIGALCGGVAIFAFTLVAISKGNSIP